MANLRNRTRVVYVRVSEDEFQRFKDLCQRRGARNMSDLVRSAIEVMVRQSASGFEQEVTNRLQKLADSLESLSRGITPARPETEA
jgi:hypothetical protein